MRLSTGTLPASHLEVAFPFRPRFFGQSGKGDNDRQRATFADQRQTQPLTWFSCGDEQEKLQLVAEIDTVPVDRRDQVAGTDARALRRTPACEVTHMEHLRLRTYLGPCEGDAEPREGWWRDRRRSTETRGADRQDRAEEYPNHRALSLPFSGRKLTVVDVPGAMSTR